MYKNTYIYIYILKKIFKFNFNTLNLYIVRVYLLKKNIKSHVCMCIHVWIVLHVCVRACVYVYIYTCKIHM